MPYTNAELFKIAKNYVTIGEIIIAYLTSLFDPPTPLIELKLAGIQIAKVGVPKAKVTIYLDEYLRGEVKIRDLVTRALRQYYFDSYLSSRLYNIKKPLLS